MERKMRIFKKDNSWAVIDSDPKVMELFGTDTLPTAFTSSAEYSLVVNSLKELNPEAEVY